MGIVCHVKPARQYPRRFNAKDVARIYCHALKQGVAASEINREVKLKCGVGVLDDNCSCEELLNDLRQARQLAELLLAVLAIMPAVGVILRLARRVGGVFKERKYNLEEVIKATEEAEKSRGFVEKELLSIKNKEVSVVKRIEESGQVVIKP